jgi:hypothetical protein
MRLHQPWLKKGLARLAKLGIDRGPLALRDFAVVERNKEGKINAT